ncbi:MAG: hypothetical protein IPG44_08225 [Anaerolineales bacterium]|jgi:hypothetical protein|nr:hypothetical protein [Chloroflexota bacterium]MBK6645727.1 hypothetical protein [Anaerolineales bacterium]MCC6987232.1 hypothetical protein [Anaerolineales bacterium]
MNKKLILLLTLLAFIAPACGGSSIPSEPADQTQLQTVVASTLQAVTQAAESRPTQPSGITVSFQNISLVIPDGLAGGASSELVPAADETNAGPWGISPEYVEFVLMDYPLTGNSLPPVIRIYPAQDYAAVNPWAKNSLEKLQAILANPSMPLTNENLSTIPFNGAAGQQYAAQAKILPLNNGNGVRMVSQYGQFPGHVVNNGSYYHYEGLTGDGKYMIAVMLPILLPLQSTAENPDADGIPYPSDPVQDENGMNAYYQGVVDLLNSASPDSFQPNLNALDALVQSIQIK